MDMNFVEILGFVAAFLTTASFLPQAIKVIKTKHTHDLSLYMYSMFFVGVCLWLTYGFMIDSLPIILANFVTLILSGTILCMKIRYK
jgi:MtN3 and saliva related transmembrane protein